MEKTPPNRPSRDSDKYIVRLPDGMRDRIAEAATENQRSMNAEIVARLQASFDNPPSKVLTINLIADEETRVKELNAVIEQLKPYLHPEQPLQVTLNKG